MILDGIASGQVGIPDGDYILYNLARHLEAKRWSVRSDIDDDGNEVLMMSPPYQCDIPFVCF